MAGVVSRLGVFPCALRGHGFGSWSVRVPRYGFSPESGWSWVRETPDLSHECFSPSCSSSCPFSLKFISMFLGEDKKISKSYQPCRTSIIHHNQVGFVSGKQVCFNIRKSTNVIHHINRLRRKNLMIISANAEKAFGKIQYSFMIKTLSQLGMEGNFLNLIKNIYETYSQHRTEWWETRSFPVEIKHKATVSPLITPC